VTDRRVFLVVVGFLGATLLVCVLAIAGLTGADKNIPGILESLAVGSLTGLAGLLAQRPTSDPQPVEVVNRGRGEAVPVSDAGYVTPAGAWAVIALLLLVAAACILATAL
jgi:hypothetical protein